MLDKQLLLPSTVLLIEAEPSLRRLIAIGLQHNGVYVVEACSLRSLAIIPQAIDLLVMDIDHGLQNDWSWRDTIQSHPQLACLPRVILTWEHDYPVSASNDLQEVVVCKPFDARNLYCVMQKLLIADTEQKLALEALAEARVLALSPQHAASIWPMVTAAGLLLAVIGLLFHIAVTIIGLIIVMIALLLWTLQAKPEVTPMPVEVNLLG